MPRTAIEEPRWAAITVTAVSIFPSYPLYPNSISVNSTSLDSALNWVWLGMAAGAVVWLACQEFRRGGRRGRWSGWCRLVAVLLASFAIFPAISNSDDLLSYSLLNSQAGRHGGYGSPTSEDPTESARAQLAGLLESLDHCRTAAIWAFAVVLFCLAITPVFRPRLRACFVTSRPGRSPPSV